MTLEEEVEALLRLREGVMHVVYLDSLGYPTGGVGHKILPADNLKRGDHIDEARVLAWLEHDMGAALAAAKRQATQAGITQQHFIAVLTSVNFELGVMWTVKFPHTWRMIVDGDYDDARDALDASLWKHQAPVRVKDFQDALDGLPDKPGS
jgi:lysozyme